jgi:hypothetical protein
MQEGRIADAAVHRATDSYIWALIMHISNKRKNLVSFKSVILLIRPSGMMPSILFSHVHLDSPLHVLQ